MKYKNYKMESDMPITYKRMISATDEDISKLISIFKLPDVSCYYSIDLENYFSYVTSNTNVFFYKVYNNNEMIGALHLEIDGETLFLSIVVFPKFQNKGNGSKIIKDVQNNIFRLEYNKIEVAIDKGNIPSLKLFKKQEFVPVSKDGNLLNYIYKMQ